MVYITGDTHGDYDIEKLSNKHFPEGRDLTREDYLIILGDFGLPFFNTDIQEDGSPAKGPYKYWIDWLSQKPYTVLWIDGNHENFNFWKEQPVSEWHGGKVQVHPHANNVIHLMRGEVYDIEGKSYLAFGGAASHDKFMRHDQISWWPEEEASAEEMQHCLDTMEQHGNRVDYILTHTPPKNVVQNRLGFENNSPTEKFLDLLQERVDYHLWFTGHFHKDVFYPQDKVRIFYNEIASLDKCERQFRHYEKASNDYCR